jgi:hypothetical protein
MATGYLTQEWKRMASLDEIVSHAQGNIGSVDSASAGIDATKGQIEELTSQFTAMGVEGLAAGTQGLQGLADEAIGSLATAKTKLEELVNAVQGLKN